MTPAPPKDALGHELERLAASYRRLLVVAPAAHALARPPGVRVVHTATPNEPEPPEALRHLPDHALDAVATVACFPGQPPPEAWCREIQRVLAPGGQWLVVDAPRAPRRRTLARLRHYFDGPHEDGAWIRTHTRRAGDVAGHFHALAPDYAAEIPAHLRDHYLEKKLRLFRDVLPSGTSRLTGLDLGCGLGWYARALAPRLDARILAVDAAPQVVRVAASARTKDGPSFAAANTLRLPFRDGSFDFAYAVNVLHHLKRGEQERCLLEIRRVLRPDAPFLLFEINVRNPLFAWYMTHVFPRTRRIDRGDEEFIHPDRLPLVPEFRLEALHHFTFVPDFLPPWALPSFRSLERLLERSPLGRHAIHYAALLRPATPGAIG